MTPTWKTKHCMRLYETTFSAITDPCNRWKALEHKEPVKSTGKVAKHRQSDKSREKLSEGRVTSAGKVTRREKSDNKQERVDKAREEWKTRGKWRNMGKVTKRGMGDKMWEMRQSHGNVTKSGRRQIANRHYSPHMQICKLHVNGALQG